MRIRLTRWPCERSAGSKMRVSLSCGACIRSSRCEVSIRLTSRLCSLSSHTRRTKPCDTVRTGPAVRAVAAIAVNTGERNDLTHDYFFPMKNAAPPASTAPPIAIIGLMPLGCA